MDKKSNRNEMKKNNSKPLKVFLMALALCGGAVAMVSCGGSDDDNTSGTVVATGKIELSGGEDNTPGAVDAANFVATSLSGALAVDADSTLAANEVAAATGTGTKKLKFALSL